MVDQIWQLAGDVILRRPIGADTPPWLPVLARCRSRSTRRSPELYDAVIDQFRVEVNQRYQRDAQGREETYCNIFVWDVTLAMGAEIPHWITHAGIPASPTRGLETSANAAIGWLYAAGNRYGWQQVRMGEAQAFANRGAPAVAVWRNEPGSGHMAMLRPGAATEDGPQLADAGEANHRRARAAHVFAAGWRGNEIAYFAHD